jgi:PUA-domain protein
MKHAMNNKEVKEFIEQLQTSFNLTYSKKDHFDKDENIILINNEPMFFYHENKLIPTLKQLLKNNLLKKITVDMGAVRFVVAGADIMRPGIKEIDEGIQKDEFVSVVDVAHKKPLAVGLALFSDEDIKAMASGKAIKNLHWIGDKVWSYNQ